ncbi:hypothetical protein SAMN04488004_13016 [Loktanella salsilacus]|uniref:Uncharacterized protein n=1 Tax=Loktanella salsilacus TaxID=195913 RepID=A0A1I4IY27_9RHOB|nr:hypothetical protein [Loktanella salsilacus]SFL58676.1 hypothetical protein SAMN04488004_13016 [Loktanella salsilacus]
MATNFFNTPPRGLKTPIVPIELAEAAAASLLAFDAGLALMQKLQRAEASLDPSGFDTALLGFEAEVADTHAQAYEALEAFYYSDKGALWHLSDAAWVMLLLLESDGLDLYPIAQRSAGLRHAAAACARSPLPLENASASRLLATAEVVDLMIEAAIDDYAVIDPDNVDDLRGLVGRGLAAAIEQTQTKHSAPYIDPCLDWDFGPS